MKGHQAITVSTHDRNRRTDEERLADWTIELARNWDSHTHIEIIDCAGAQPSARSEWCANALISFETCSLDTQLTAWSLSNFEKMTNRRVFKRRDLVLTTVGDGLSDWEAQRRSMDVAEWTDHTRLKFLEDRKGNGRLRLSTKQIIQTNDYRKAGLSS